MASQDFSPQSAIGLNILGMMPMSGMPMPSGMPMAPGMSMAQGISMTQGIPMASGMPMMSGIPMTPGIQVANMNIAGMAGPGGATEGPHGRAHYQVGGDTYSVPQRRTINNNSNNKVLQLVKQLQPHKDSLLAQTSQGKLLVNAKTNTCYFRLIIWETKCLICHIEFELLSDESDCLSAFQTVF